MPVLLHWLSGGLLSSRLLRTVRLWDCLRDFYSPASSVTEPWASEPWTEAFSYPEWRDRRFAPSHDTHELATPDQIVAPCQGTTCLCQRSGLDLLWGEVAPPKSWIQEVAHLAHLSPEALEEVLRQAPFAVVHRVLRNDLKALVQQGFLDRPRRGYYQCRPPQALPTPAIQESAALSPHPLASLSDAQGWDMFHALESVAFLQPSLEPVIRQIWEHQTQQAQGTLRVPMAQRIFFEVNYIFAEADLDRVDTYQSQLEQLWQSPAGGVVQFESWLPHCQSAAQATVYPVCIHYTRRAKYLSAYGANADQSWGWHNYRLDRIQSPLLRVLPWGDPAIPDALRELWRSGGLPQPEDVRDSLEEAWGFNFYLPKSPMILRFNRRFAQDYVIQTQRHPTFQVIPYAQILGWLRESLGSDANLTDIQELLVRRSPEDVYFRAWVRLMDINLVMRLREWRPAGEVLFPLKLRGRMLEEMELEAKSYRKGE